MKVLTAILLLLPSLIKAQHTGFSFELSNEIGTYKLTSLTFSHRQDNTEGVTYVVSKRNGDTIYQIDAFLNGYVALSTDGKTIAHLLTEINDKPLNESTLTFYRDGKKYESTKLNRFIKYYLDEKIAKKKLSEKGWLRNDSLLHKMASNPFYITEDKVYISFDNPTLSVFDLNRMFHVYTGNGANHFSQNYYSVPNAPYRVEYNSEEYSPKEFPRTVDGRTFEGLLSKTFAKQTCNPDSAKIKVLVAFKLSKDGITEIRKADVQNAKSGKLNEGKTASLKSILEGTSFQIDLFPPDHSAWVFSTVFWLK